MKELNRMGRGMQPLNYASKLVKIATDVMFFVAVNDEVSVDSRLDEAGAVIAALRKFIEGYRRKE
jgi:hypothetical protein